MRYYVGHYESQEGYRFIYDDETKVCRYERGKDEITKVIDLEPVNMGRYKMMGFRGTSELFCNICMYKVNDYDMYMQVIICSDSSIFVVIKSRFGNSFANLEFVGCFEYGIRKGMFNDLSLRIPVQMLDYILHLKSEHNFEKLMMAFSGLFGALLPMFCGSLGISHRVEVLNWMEEF